jgi:hypothetical protein
MLTKRQIERKNKKALLLVIFTAFGIWNDAKAATYLKCKSKDIATCTEVYKKGQVIKALAVDPTLVFVKLDFMRFDSDKGTLKIDND